MADALLVFWQQQLAIYQAEQKAAQDDLAKEQASLQTANAQLATDQKALDKAGSDISAARAKLAVTTVPADATALITQITQMIIAQRGLQGAVSRRSGPTGGPAGFARFGRGDAGAHVRASRKCSGEHRHRASRGDPRGICTAPQSRRLRSRP